MRHIFWLLCGLPFLAAALRHAVEDASEAAAGSELSTLGKRMPPQAGKRKGARPNASARAKRNTRPVAAPRPPVKAKASAPKKEGTKESCDAIAKKTVQTKMAAPSGAVVVACKGGAKASLEAIADSSPTMAALRSIMVVKDTHNLGVGLDVAGDAQPYQDLHIAAAWKLYNPSIGESYVRTKCGVEQRFDPKTTKVGVPIPDMNEGIPGNKPLDKHLNEKYFFHGTSSPDAVEPILCGGLTRGGGLFGEGVYLADRPEKLDQYTNHGAEEGGRVVDKFSVPRPKLARIKGRFFYSFVVRALLGHTFEGMCTCENCRVEARRYPHLIMGERCVRCGRLAMKVGGVKRFINANLTFDPLQPGRVKGIEPLMSKDKNGYMKYASSTASYDSIYARASLHGCIKRYNEAVVPLMSDRIMVEYVVAYQRCKQRVTKETPCDPIV